MPLRMINLELDTYNEKRVYKYLNKTLTKQQKNAASFSAIIKIAAEQLEQHSTLSVEEACTISDFLLYNVYSGEGLDYNNQIATENAYYEIKDGTLFGEFLKIELEIIKLLNPTLNDNCLLYILARKKWYSFMKKKELYFTSDIYDL
jgi:hypothetical protein